VTNAGPPLTGLLLAGGQARRLGGDKALVDLGGRTLLERAGTLALACCDEVLLLDGERALHLPGLRRLPDLPSVDGPLGGLGAGLAEAKHPWCLLLSCDQPFISTAVVARLLDRLNATEPQPLAVVLHDAHGIQPFCGLYHRDLLPELQRRTAAGERSLRGFLSACEPQGVTLVELDELPAELAADTLFDVDTPADLAHARAVCAS
jgi:molybdopterin-guanine dinucleotide biosynthesis protein A